MSISLEVRRKRKNRNFVDRFIIVLNSLVKTPRGKFSIMCQIETDTRTTDNLLNIAMNHGLVTLDNKMYCLTLKGRKFLEVWNS